MDTIIRQAELEAAPRLLARPARGRGHAGPGGDLATPSVPDGLDPASAEPGRIESGLAREADARQLAQAQEQGYTAGVELGTAQALRAREQELARLRVLADRLLASHQDALALAEDDMVAFCLTVLHRLLGDGAGDRARVDAALRQVLAEARHDVALVVRLHPDDLHLLASGADGMMAGADARLQFKADATVCLGGCLVDSPAGSLDARIETQLARLHARVLAVRAERRAALGERP